MGKYIHKFNDRNSFESEYYGQNYLEPWVSLYPDDLLIWNLSDGKTITVEFLGKHESQYDDGTYTYNANLPIFRDINSETLYCTESSKTTSKYPGYIKVGTHVLETTFDSNQEVYVTEGQVSKSSLTLTDIKFKEQLNYNKKSSENVDIVFKYDAEYECNGQEIIYMTQNFGSYELTQDLYYYNVTNSNLTTSPIQSIKVQVLHNNDFDGIYNLPLTEHDESSNYWTLTLTNPYEMYLSARSNYDSETQKWTFDIRIGGGC